MKKITLALILTFLISFFISFVNFENSVHAILYNATFNSTGVEQTWVVPSGITLIDVNVTGAGGGASTGGAGKGGTVLATIRVTPGETLFIYVGGVGRVSSGGFNGGGNGGSANAGGGGGASDIRRVSNGLANRVVVAAGGGGNGNLGGGGGAAGGLTGTQGQAPGSGSPGGGATQTAGGIAGNAYVGGGSGTAGSLGQGGSGGTGASGGAGGGGGYYGGGGSGGSDSNGNGGGGGSSYCNANCTNILHFNGTDTYNSGNGTVTIFFDNTTLTYSQNTTNSTTPGQTTLFSFNWTDDVALNNTGGYIFSFDNGTGTFVNDSFHYFGEVNENSTDWKTGLLALWHMNEGDGSVIADSNNHGQNGTWTNPSNNVTWLTNSSCMFGSCLSFDGSDDFINISNSNFIATTSGTVAFWINNRNLATYKNIFLRLNPGVNTEFSIHSGWAANTMGIWLNNVQTEFSHTFSANVWYHVVITWDGTNARLFVNGTFRQAVATANSPPSTSTIFIIGAGYAEQAGNNFNGMLDDIAVWSRNFSAAEIQQIYNLSSKFPTQSWSNVTKFTNSTGGTNIRWRLYANDSAGNVNTTDIFCFTQPCVASAINYVSRVGNAYSWTWSTPTSGTSIVRSGNAYSWTWQTSSASSGRKVPQGGSTSWTWGSE